MQPDQKRKIHNPFIAMKHPEFRLYTFGMVISMIGSWMQNIAQPWLAYTLTSSPFLLSLVAAMLLLPIFLFSAFAGVIIDYFPKKRILILTQACSVLITLALAILVWTGKIEFWHILILSFLLGTVNSIDIPARASFIVSLVDPEEVPNAVAMNATIFNTARIIGPALAGLAMGYLGIAYCFFLNSVSFTVVIVCLLFIKPRTVCVIPKRTSTILSNVKDGLLYIRRTKLLFNTMILCIIFYICTMNFSVLIPVFAKKILLQQETGFGFLMSFMGIGSLSGALYVAMTSRYGPSRLIRHAMPILAAVLLFLTAFSRQYLLTGVLLALTGFCFVSFSASANTVMQLNTADEYRGRVMSIYNLIFNGSALIGNLMTGFIADQFGPEYGFAFSGMLLGLLLTLAAIFKAAKKPESNF